MRDIAYDHMGEVKVMSAAEVASGEAHFFRSAYLMEDINRVTREIMRDTMERVEKRPCPTEVIQTAKDRQKSTLWHLRRITKPCRRATPTTAISRMDFGRKVRQGARVCHACLTAYDGRKSQVFVTPKVSPFFDKYADAHAPVDVMSK